MTSVPNVKRGVCVNGVCHCYNGFSGPDCSFGPGPDNKDNFPIKDKAILKILAEEDDNTCDYDSCYSTLPMEGPVSRSTPASALTNGEKALLTFCFRNQISLKRTIARVTAVTQPRLKLCIGSRWCPRKRFTY